MQQPKSDPADTRRWVQRLKAGDQKAFENIFFQYHKMLRAFAFAELKSEDMAEDAVQEVFCKLWIKRASLNEDLSPRSYLFTCMKNHLLNLFRTQQNEIKKNYQFAYRQTFSHHTTEQQVLSQEINQRVTDFLQHLPALKRKILELSLYQGWSNSHIARKLQLSSNTVKMYLSQSTRQLRKVIETESLKAILIVAAFFC